MNPITAEEWNSAAASLPGAHILQSWEWGQFKAISGWQPLPQLWRDEQGQVRAAALVLRRTVLRRFIPGGISVMYVPRGPLVDWNDQTWAPQVIEDLQVLARRQRAIFIKIDPELILGTGIPGSETEKPNPAGEQFFAGLKARGWRLSDDQIQFRNTVLIDLSGDEAQWLEHMKQKTRYNLRLAQRKGVQVRVGSADDFPMLYNLYAQTSVRDGFVIRAEDYYLSLWRSFNQRGLAEPLIAEVDGEPVAGLILFTFAGRAWYLYGMSSQAHREKMPNYLLQWEAMRRAKALGCDQYDLWGAPDVFDESDSMWGVFRFKEGLGGTVIRTAGAMDYPARPQLYVLYTRILPRILDVMRRRRTASTRQEVSL
jgi:peptidoglycan pentaglycine glycine transferase (the first glycine)